MTGIERFDLALPHGITLACRAAGEPGRPLMLFLHGFPQGAFVWDDLLLHFSQPGHGGYRCIAPNLRGYAGSSAPADVQAYRPRHLVQDISALARALGGPSIAALVAHDWGGAIAWNLAAQEPALLQRLVILNAPHPLIFCARTGAIAGPAGGQRLHELPGPPRRGAEIGRGRFQTPLGLAQGHGDRPGQQLAR
jgi:pimeloyl-ACP methyl ester carboxylesterase